MMAEERPNILLIMADQMAYDVIGALGHPVVRTPNLDRLVSSGTVFTNAYCNSPLCAPSRACLATGRLLRHTGVFDNAAELSASAPTVMHLLRLGGYRTIASGKLHFIGADQLHGFEERLTTDIFPSDFSWTPDWSKGPVLGKTNAGKARSADTCDWNIYLQYDEEVLFRTLERLRQISEEKRDRPFFFQVSFTHTHPPFQALERFAELYRNAEIPLPAAAAPDPQRLHPYDRWLQTMHGVDTIQLTPDEIRRARKIYYAMVSYVDEMVGRIREELERLGLAQTTRLVFTSDHGELLGEHGNWFKRHYFEHSIRVPLILAGPGVPAGRRSDSVVSLVDLSATLARWGGAARKHLEWMDGSSFDGLLEGRATGWKNRAIFEYAGKGTIRYMSGIRSGRYKYVYVRGNRPLLFDLEKDPGESANLAEEPALAELREQLEAALLNGIDPGNLEQRILSSQQQRLLIRRAAAAGKRHPWDHQPEFKGEDQYIRE